MGYEIRVENPRVGTVLRAMFERNPQAARQTEYSTQAKMVDTGTGSLYIVGSFKRMSHDPDFKDALVSVPQDMCCRGTQSTQYYHDHKSIEYPGSISGAKDPGYILVAKYPGFTPGVTHPGPIPSAKYPGFTPGVTHPGSIPSAKYSGYIPSAKYPGSVPSVKYPGSIPGAKYPGYILVAKYPGFTPGVTHPGPIPSAKYPGFTPGVTHPGPIPSAKYPGFTPGVTHPGSIPSAKYPGFIPDLFLSSNVTTSDFNMGYSMTGTLERGDRKTNSFQMTHFAVIRRWDRNKD
uniref:Uncharacterized protein n=1 Tax=Timema douglasi TaxID=61478 RepID=A0A7R8VJ03_TIMDO|nr:unnamed protein product [Timema douglasi]